MYSLALSGELNLDLVPLPLNRNNLINGRGLLLSRRNCSLLLDVDFAPYGEC